MGPDEREPRSGARGWGHVASRDTRAPRLAGATGPAASLPSGVPHATRNSPCLPLSGLGPRCFVLEGDDTLWPSRRPPAPPASPGENGKAAGCRAPREPPTARVLAFSLGNRWCDIVPLEVMRAWLETAAQSPRPPPGAVPRVCDTRRHPRSAGDRPGFSRSAASTDVPRRRGRATFLLRKPALSEASPFEAGRATLRGPHRRPPCALVAG